MTPIVVAVSYLMGVGTVLINIALIVFIIVTLLSPRWREWLHEHTARHGALVSFGIVAASLVGSLFYSEVAGFAACLLCWVVRATVYPQIVLLGAYLYKPRRWYMVASLVMSSIAALASAYQVLLQFSSTVSTLCDSVPGLGDCQVEYFRIFGYVNIATMSLVATLALVVCQAVSLHRKHWLRT